MRCECLLYGVLMPVSIEITVTTITSRSIPRARRSGMDSDTIRTSTIPKRDNMCELSAGLSSVPLKRRYYGGMTSDEAKDSSNHRCGIQSDFNPLSQAELPLIQQITPGSQFRAGHTSSTSPPSSNGIRDPHCPTLTPARPSTSRLFSPAPPRVTSCSSRVIS
jgi:hypothetical protein